jgi:hypothetical protein
MFTQLDLTIKLILGVSSVLILGWRLWLLSVTVRDMVKSVRQNECKIDALEKEILDKLEKIHVLGREAGKRSDERLERIDRRLHFLFGIINKTVPPND